MRGGGACGLVLGLLCLLLCRFCPEPKAAGAGIAGGADIVPQASGQRPVQDLP